MKHRPHVVAFDVIETTFSLESMRPRLQAAGLPGHLLETWFAQLLRDAFALDASGVYKPFRDVAAARLECLTGYVARDAAMFPSIMDPPHVTGATLVEVAEKLCVEP